MEKLSEQERDEIVAQVARLLREEWEAGSGGMPGLHHQPVEAGREQIARRIFG